MLKSNLKNALRKALVRTNTAFSLSPPVIDNCDICDMNSTNAVSREECIKDLKKIKSAIEKMRIKYKDFLYNQICSLIIFLEYKEELKFEDLLRTVFGVKPLDINNKIKQMEKKLSKLLNTNDLCADIKHWKENIIIPNRLIRRYCIDITNLLHDLTEEKTRIGVPPPKIIIDKSVVGCWHQMLKEPVLRVNIQKVNLFTLIKILSHETFPGHHFSGMVRRKYFGKEIPDLNITYSPLASFEEGFAECGLYLLFGKFDNLFPDLKIADLISKIQYAYHYKAAKLFYKKKGYERIVKCYSQCKFFDDRQISQAVNFLLKSNIYAAIYYPSYVTMEKIFKEYAFNTIDVVSNILTSEPLDLKLLAMKFESI
jgi:hypothetical protein